MKIQDIAGGIVDEAFLALPRILKNFVPKRKISAQDFEQELDFYFEQGFVDRPSSFFLSPDKTPDWIIAEVSNTKHSQQRQIRFQSSYQVKNPKVAPRYESHIANRTACIYLWSKPGGPPRPLVLCLHGFMLGDPDQALAMFRVQKMLDAGLDVALFIAPFHADRSSSGKAGARKAISPDDPAMTTEFMGQAQHDLACSLAILRQMGAPRIGIIGASLGGYLAGQLASLEYSKGVDFCALMVPGVSFEKPIGPDSFALPFSVNDRLKKKIHSVWNFHSPLNMELSMPKGNLLIVASTGDRLCPFVYTRKLCEKWGWPEHHFLDGGHWLMFSRAKRGKAWYNFLQRQGFIS
ncbi:MAG: alpha/beta hydrolase [Desulfatibacillaceae bacterium]|nr:alpha/beta hydrolase [Desulfatibacillaceae bacterium]